MPSDNASVAEFPGGFKELSSVLRLQYGPPLKLQNGTSSLQLQYATAVPGGSATMAASAISEATLLAVGESGATGIEDV